MTIFDNVNKFMDIKTGKKWYSLSAVIYILKEKEKQGKKKIYYVKKRKNVQPSFICWRIILYYMKTNAQITK